MYNVLVAAPPENTSFVCEQCEVYGLLTCFGFNPSTASSTYNPPFVYSYQCSASFVTYYAPTFLYVCFVAAVITPLMLAIGYYAHSPYNTDTYAYRAVNSFLPRIFKPIDASRLNIQRDDFHPYFDANMVLIYLLTYLGVMLTFGAVFPPLAAALCFTIIAVACFERLKMGRFVYNSIEANALVYLDVVEQECQGIGSIRKLNQAVWMLSCFCFLFYSTFLFDTLGNSVGVGRAAWVFLVVPLVPVVFYVCMVVYSVYVERNGRAARASKGVSAIELNSNHLNGISGVDKLAHHYATEDCEGRRADAIGSVGHGSDVDVTFNVLQEFSLNGNNVR